jgi:hypothetical protein
MLLVEVYSKKQLEIILKAQLLGSCCLLFPVGSLSFHLSLSYAQPVTFFSYIMGIKAQMYVMYFAELLPVYPEHMTMYTDGSFFQGSIRCAFMSGDRIFSYSLYHLNSVCMAELYSIYQALLCN